MEVRKKNHPSLPANYVSLADLQQRWIKQQQEKRENAEETAKPESLKVQEPNPSFKHNPTFRGNHGDRKVPKVYRVVQVSNPSPNACATVKTGSELGNGNAVKVKKTNKKWSEKKPMKKMAEFESSEIEAPVTIGADSLIGGKRKKKKRGEKKKKIKNTPQSENEATITMGVITDGGDQNTNGQIGGKQQNKNNKVQKQIKKQNSVPEKQNPVVNANCGGEGENQEKGGSEVSEKHSVGGRMVEIGQQFNQLSVTGSGRGKQKNTPQSENEAIITMGVITDGGDQNANDQIGGKQQNKNNKVQKQIKKQKSVPEKQNPVVNANCGGEGENQEKAGSEVSEKHSVVGRMVEIGRRFNQLSMTGSGRGKERWMPGSDGPRNAYGTYGSGLRREIGIKKRVDGLVWVKKEVVLDNSER